MMNCTPLLLFGLLSMVCMIYPVSSEEQVDDYDDDYDAYDVGEDPDEDDVTTKRSIPDDDDDDDDVEMESLDKLERDASAVAGRRRRVYHGGRGNRGDRRRWWGKK